MYGCEKTINTCISYAGVEMKALVAHPSWLYVKPKIIKMALDIEEGALPEETELYEAVLLWAKQREDKITIIPKEQAIEEQEVKNLSMTRTQLLASVVVVEPLAISSAVVEPDEDDYYEEEEEEEEDQKHSMVDSTNEEGEGEGGKDQKVILHSPKREIIMPMDPHDLQLDLANILQCIRFPIMPPDYLANRVEKDSFIMNIDGMKDMLYETYKYHAVVGISSSIRCQPRRPSSEQQQQHDEL